MKLKRIILQSYNLTADAYLKSFRGMKRSGASTYKMFLTSLREMMQRYMDACKIATLSDLVEANIQEQFLNVVKRQCSSVCIVKVSKDCSRMGRACRFACYDIYDREGDRQTRRWTTPRTGRGSVDQTWAA